MNYWLAIDTSSDSCSLALRVDGQDLQRFAVIPRQHTALVMEMLYALLAEAGLTLAKVRGIVVSRGPSASFTGIRLAIGLAQGLAYGLNLPIVPVSTLAGLAQQWVKEDLQPKLQTQLQSQLQPRSSQELSQEPLQELSQQLPQQLQQELPSGLQLAVQQEFRHEAAAYQAMDWQQRTSVVVGVLVDGKMQSFYYAAYRLMVATGELVEVVQEEELYDLARLQAAILQHPPQFLLGECSAASWSEQLPAELVTVESANYLQAKYLFPLAAKQLTEEKLRGGQFAPELAVPCYLRDKSFWRADSTQAQLVVSGVATAAVIGGAEAV